MRHVTTISIALALTMVLMQPSAAQNPQSSSKKPGNVVERLSVQIGLGLVRGGPAESLYRYYEENGYAAEYDGNATGCNPFCFDGTVTYPKRHAAKAWSSPVIVARYTVSPSLAITGGIDKATLGGAEGHRASFEFVESDWSARAVWTGVLLTPAKGIRVGGGPALYHLTEESFSGRKDYDMAGAFAEAGIVVAVGRVFLDVSDRVHFVRSPSDSTDPGGLSGPQVKPQLRHSVFAISIGANL